jgi:hypothetical protein
MAINMSIEKIHISFIECIFILYSRRDIAYLIRGNGGNERGRKMENVIPLERLRKVGNISRAYVHKIRTRRVQPSPDMILRIYQETDLTMSELLTDGPIMNIAKIYHSEKMSEDSGDD